MLEKNSNKHDIAVICAKFSPLYIAAGNRKIVGSKEEISNIIHKTALLISSEKKSFVNDAKKSVAVITHAAIQAEIDDID